MAQAKNHLPVKLFVGMIFSSDEVLLRVKSKLRRKFGPLDFQSGSIPFAHTTYYEEEMGPHLRRQFLSFKKLIDAGNLPSIKRYTNRLERYLSKKATTYRRAINLDPGYLSLAKVVLATCKDYGHRIYLGEGIYGEVTLHFRDGSFQPWEWTYPDYKTKDYIDIFNEIRKVYLVSANDR